MGDRRRRSCRSCGRHDSKCGPISWTGLCLTCAQRRLQNNIEGIALKQGMPYRRWALGVARYGQRLLLDVTGESVDTDDRAR